MEELLDVGAVDAVAALADKAGRILSVDGREYSTVELHDPRKPEPTPKALNLTTLQSFAEFAQSAFHQPFSAPRGGVFVHVVGPTEVLLRTGVFGDRHQSTSLATAEPLLPNVRFKEWKDPETFTIEMQSCFEDRGDRSKVLALIGTVREEAVRTLEDDGVTQTATARKGVVGSINVTVPNPVVLVPWRTFAEVSQPASEFILRLRGGGDARLPTVALFPADGGLWRLEAIDGIKEWLVKNVSDIPVYG